MKISNKNILENGGKQNPSTFSDILLHADVADITIMEICYFF